MIDTVGVVITLLGINTLIALAVWIFLQDEATADILGITLVEMLLIGIATLLAVKLWQWWSYKDESEQITKVFE